MSVESVVLSKVFGNHTIYTRIMCALARFVTDRYVSDPLWDGWHLWTKRVMGLMVVVEL
jgi:hypothetical protein